MTTGGGYFDAEYFMILVNARGGAENFIVCSGISKQHFYNIVSGRAELRQSEMLNFASVLGLTELEFLSCFFSN